MKGVRYHLSIPRYLLQRALGRRWPALYYRPPFSCLQLDELPAPPLPGPGWGRIRPRLAGICGSDMGTVTGKNSPVLSPFVSFPAVLGHEVVGELVDLSPTAGAATDAPRLQVGDRVVVDPALPCHARGLTPPCPACQRGETYLCERTADGRLSPGLILGFCRDLPGAWAEEMVAPLEQIFPVPAELNDEQAVLVEPLSIAVRAVLRGWPGPSSVADATTTQAAPAATDAAAVRPPVQVLILGAGTIGLSVIAALRLLGAAARITVTARYSFQEQMAYRLGADRVYRGRNAAVSAAQRETGARRYRPILGPPVYTGGFDLVFDSVGSHSTVNEALRLTRAGGRILLVGAAGQLPPLDWTFIWSRELTIIGSCGYGRERHLPAAIASWFTPSNSGSAPHTYQITLEALHRHPDYPVAQLVTHRFPLSEFRTAVAYNVHHGQHQVIKTVFDLHRSSP